MEAMNGMEEMDGMDGNGTLDRAARARALAAEFLGDNGHLKRVHVGDGVLAATDARILLHVTVPGIQREDVDGEEVGILRFGVEKIASEAWRGWPRMGGLEWCQKTLLPAVWPRWQEAVKESQKKSQESRWQFERGRRDARRTCPCCCEEVFEEDGRLVSAEDWEKLNSHCVYRPVDANVYIEIALPGMRLVYNAAYLKLALDAVRDLGGLQGVFVAGDDSECAVFVGRGWFVWLMPVRMLGVDMDADWGLGTPVFAEGAEREWKERQEGGPAAARQDGDAAEAERKGGE